jgi:hypothetical protein
MRKQELIHLHTLLAEVAGYCEREGVSPSLERYRSCGTRPMTINDSKDDHEEAVLALARGLAAPVDGDPERTAVATD